MSTKMTRITEKTEKDLEFLKDTVFKGTKESKQSMIEKAVDRYVREQFIKKANEQFTRMKNEDPVGWKQMIKEEEVFDGTLADGLDDE